MWGRSRVGGEGCRVGWIGEVGLDGVASVRRIRCEIMVGMGVRRAYGGAGEGIFGGGEREGLVRDGDGDWDGNWEW